MHAAPHAIHTASWIWLVQPEPIVNQYACFRKSFGLAKRPRRTTLAIAADTDFVVWVNGHEAERFQFTDWQQDRTFSEFDIAPLLKTGDNSVAVLVHHRGENFSTYATGRPGLIAAITLDKQTIITDQTWLARQHPAYTSGPIAKVTMQLGHTAIYDARLEDNWLAINYDDTGWAPARVQQAEAVGDYWRSLEPRPVPAVQLLPPVPVRVAMQGELIRTRWEGSAAERIDADALIARPYWTCFVNAKFFAIKTYNDQPPQPHDFLEPHSSEGLELTPPDKTEDGLTLDGRYVVIDLGEESVGLLTIHLDAPEGTVLDIAHGEHLDDGRVRANVGGRNFADRYICSEGDQTWTLPFRRLGLRYLALHITNFNRPIRFHYAGICPTPYPLEIKGRFETPDPLAMRSHAIALRTLDLCMHDHYEDCPWREQAMYAYDTRNQMLYGYYAFGNEDFAKASLTLMGRSLREDGLLELTSPGRSRKIILIFSHVWITAIAEWQRFTGRRDLSDAFLDQAQHMIDGWLSRRDEATGLCVPLDTPDKYWHFYDWRSELAGAPMIGHPREGRLDALYNLYLIEAMQSLAWMHDEAGQAGEARAVRKAAAALAQLVDKAFWNPEQNAYATYRREDRHDHFCQLTQTLALLLGVAKGTHRAAMLKHVVNETLVPMTLSSLPYLVMTLMPLGKAARAHLSRLVSSNWEPMTFAGATTYWETLRGSGDFSLGGSLCHGWSALPAYWHMACVLGVQPTSAGYSTFAVRPYPDRFPSANGTVPTPRGPLHIDWRRTDKGLVVELRGPKTLKPTVEAYPEAPIAKATWNGKPLRVGKAR